MSVTDDRLRAALAHHESGDLSGAEQAYRQILCEEPENAPAVHFLGMLAHQTGRHAEGLGLLRRSVELAGAVAEFHSNLATVYGQLGHPDDAVKCLREALRLRPDFFEAHKNLGLALEQSGRLEEAAVAYAEATRHARGSVASCEVHYHHGRVFQKLGRLQAAEDAYRRALAAEPGRAEANFALSGLYATEGRVEDAALLLQRFVQIRPDLPLAHSDLLFTLLHHPGYGPAALFDEHRLWADRHARPLESAIRQHENDRGTDRPLRVGYVSPDLREHSVATFFEPLLRAHDRSGFFTVCYSDVARPDEVTSRLRRSAAAWRDIAGRTDEEVADLIRTDRIDILVDLAGHMAGGRMTLFARKPAPVQVTYLGYPHSTGLRAMDYRVAIALTDPPGEADAFHTEQVVRLSDCAWCYQADAGAPPVNDLPALANGFVTFGSFNRPYKISARVVRLWSRLLLDVPGSRLLLVLVGPEAAPRVRREFERNGVHAGRVDVVAGGPKAEYLRLYHRVDLALDPFPYNGMTTTCDSLWMGVPVVSLVGRTHASRAGLGLLSQVGLSDLAADSPDVYLAAASSLAADPDRLRSIRAGLRDVMRASPLTDGPGCAARLEVAYRAMWARWCAGDDARPG
jgi:predicted O-linked N-acetylglucosamine transferase (SPINDLY family)